MAVIMAPFMPYRGMSVRPARRVTANPRRDAAVLILKLPRE